MILVSPCSTHHTSDASENITAFASISVLNNEMSWEEKRQSTISGLFERGRRPDFLNVAERLTLQYAIIDL